MADDATVRVVVNAVTEAAEQAIDEVGDEITGLSGDATVGQTALDELSDEMSEAERHSVVLQTAMDQLSDEVNEVGNSSLYAQTALDELSDEMGEATAQATASAGAMSSLGAATSAATGGFISMRTALILSLIPSLLTLSTILAPMVAGLVAAAGAAVALGGAFAAIVGSGILAFGQKRADQNKKQLAQTERLIAQYESLKKQTGSLNAREEKRLRNLRKRKKKLEDQTTVMGALKGAMSDLTDEIKPMIVAFGENFIPLIEAALGAIPTLVEDMIAAVGGTEQFEDALSDFGAIAMDVLPALVSFMFDLAEKALPFARDFFNFLLEHGDEAVADIAASMEELGPEMSDFLDALVDAAPTLLKFGTVVANKVLPPLTDLINASADFMKWVNELDGGLQDLVVWTLLLAPAIVYLGGKMAGLVGILTGKGGLIAGAGKLAGVLGGGGAATTAGIYGAAILAGAGLGLLGVKALDAMGAFQKLRKEGKKLRDEIGGKKMDKALAQVNAATLGGFEAFSKAGVSIVDVVQGEKDMGADERKQIGETFSRGEETLANQIINGGVNVSVDAQGHVQRNPYQWSRKAGQQLQRETRQQHGAGR